MLAHEDRLKILTVVGARPQFVKASAVSRVIAEMPSVDEVIVHTGQHYGHEMSDVFFEDLGIPGPVRDLEVGSATHGKQTGRMLEAVEAVLLEEIPDWVLVYGDTNSTLAGALAAVKLHIPVAHVEAGLRSFNRRMPEEINRVLTDHASDLLFAPTEVSVQNLLREGIPSDKVRRVGDVMFDVALFSSDKAERESDALFRCGLRVKEYILTTIHRAENTDDLARLQAIFQGLNRVAGLCDVVVPLHPRTRAALKKHGLLDESLGAIRLIDPVGYLDMVMLTKHARLVVTDSGGVQKEAFFVRVPCVTLREETEWTELVTMGWNRLLPPTNARAIYEGVRQALSEVHTPAEPSDLPYGTGDAALRIVRHLTHRSK